MPTIFLSSTVLDLRDLRSGVKYWLEEQGFVVHASEYPDFPYALDRNAVAAALAPIDASDYYILIAGARRGQLVADEGISVTRAEFRHARKRRRQTGNPQMLHLVRREISEARETGRPQSVSEQDWPDIRSFLDEITREGERGDPNWLSQFDTFRDVVDVLRATLRITGPLARRALEANLLWELKANARELLGRSTSGIRPHALFFQSDLQFPSRIDDSVEIQPREALAMFMFRLTLRKALGVSALAESINSGAFLEYDVSANSYVVGPQQRAMLELRQQVESLGGIVGTISTDSTIAADTTELADAARQNRSARITAFSARMLYAAWSATMNVLRLSRAIYRVFTGIQAEIEVPTLTPLYALDEESRMSTENVTEQDAEAWLRSSSWRMPANAGSRSP